MQYYKVTITYQNHKIDGTNVQETFECIRMAEKASTAISIASSLFGSLSNTKIKQPGVTEWVNNLVIVDVEASIVNFS